jgi:hypothetical protein
MPVDGVSALTLANDPSVTVTVTVNVAGRSGFVLRRRSEPGGC